MTMHGGVPSDTPEKVSERRYSLNDVLTAERPGDGAEHGGIAFHFDGICIVGAARKALGVPDLRRVAPKGWRHRGHATARSAA